MERKNIFWVLITIGIAIIVLVIAINLIFKSDSVNEGKFRVSDAILSSSAKVENKTSINNEWSIDLSQNNRLSLLLTKAEEANISSISLEDISVNKGNITIYQVDSENKIKINDESKNLELEYTVDENNQILIELNILNENILKNWRIPEGTNEIVYDGRIFKTAGISIKDIQFKISFKLVITEVTGKQNIMKIKLTMPYEELLDTGASVRRLDLSNFKFKVM